MASHICQVCHVNPATIHVTDLTGGKKVETHICEACGAASGAANEGGFVASMMGVAKGLSMPEQSCPHCGMTFEEFRAKGRLGCPNDYDVFRKALVPLLMKMHAGAQSHKGRLPGDRDEVWNTVNDRLLYLRRQLATAVEEENYEEAARLRDEIAEIEARVSANRPWSGL